MLRKVWFELACLAVVTCVAGGSPSPSSPQQQEKQGFRDVSLPASVPGENQYLFGGANQWQLWSLPRENVSLQLDAMRDAKLALLRTFVDSRFEGPSLGVYNDSRLDDLAFLIKSCASRDIKVMIALINNGDALYFDAFGKVGFYNDSTARTRLKSRYEWIIGGLLSRLSPSEASAIYAWELQNEPGVCFKGYDAITLEQKYQVLRDWMTEMSLFIKALDGRRRVSLGIAGYENYYQGGSADDIRTLGDIEGADIYTLHYYGEDKQTGRGGSLQEWLDDNLDYVRSLGKLLMVQEFGVTRDEGPDATLDMYRNVTQTCVDNGVPFMFWRLGQAKRGSCWMVWTDDVEVWSVIKQSSTQLRSMTTQDNWGVVDASLPLDPEIIRVSHQ